MRVLACVAIILGIGLSGWPAFADDPPHAPQVAMAINASGASIGVRLSTLIVSIDYKDANIAEAFAALSAKSKTADPDGAGVDFVVEPSALDSAKTISINLHNVSVGSALENLCKLACVKPKIDPAAVHLVSMHESVDLMDQPSVDQGESHRLIVHKMQTLVIDKVNFKNLDIALAIQFLALRTRAVDPDKEGVNFVLGNIGPTDNIQRHLTLSANNIPLPDLLNLISQQTGLRYLIEDGAVYFKP